MTLYIPDVSEYQGAVDWAALAAARPVVIIRAGWGVTPDAWYVRNRSGAHAHGAAAVGLYWYLTAGTDPARQAAAFCDLVGELLPTEFAAVDVEEGTGDQSQRADAFWSAVASRLHPASEGLYSGASFYAVHGLGTARTPPAVTRWVWLAQYAPTPPGPAHDLWQYTAAASVPGVAGPCDQSVYAGTLPQFVALVLPALPASSTSPPPRHPTEDDMAVSYPIPPGWCVDHTGAVVGEPHPVVLTGAGSAIGAKTCFVSVFADTLTHPGYVPRVRVATSVAGVWTVSEVDVPNGVRVPVPGWNPAATPVDGMTVGRVQRTPADTADAVALAVLVEYGY